MRKLKRNKPTARFCTILGTINIFAICYVMAVCLRARSIDEQLTAAFTLVGVGLLLIFADIMSIVVVHGE